MSVQITVKTARYMRLAITCGVQPEFALWRSGCCPIALTPMSKKTKKRKARMRRSKANHGKRPNMGRG
jgi:hypothetical protein